MRVGYDWFSVFSQYCKVEYFLLGHIAIVHTGVQNDPRNLPVQKLKFVKHNFFLPTNAYF